MWHIFWKIFIAFWMYCNQAEAQGTSCKWDVMHCDKSEVLCSEGEQILLDSKNPLHADHCFAIKDNDNGDFRNYEIRVDLLSLESNEGQNSGYLGIIFNYLDQMNYDFIYLEIHNSPTSPPRFGNATPAFMSGYRLNGEFFHDERIVINESIDGTAFHSLKLVIDNNSASSTKVFLDRNFIGSFQEHFVPRLKGGVFIINQFGSVGLFKNFRIKGCKKFIPDGECADEYDKGPSLKNSAYEFCSTAVGNLTWAMDQCDNDANCYFVHDYSCDDINWRYCTNVNMANYLNKDPSPQACSWVKKSSVMWNHVPMTIRTGDPSDSITIEGGKVWHNDLVFYTNLPPFIQRRLPMYGTSDINTSDQNILVLKTRMTAYMIRDLSWNAVDLNGWTLLGNGTYLGPLTLRVTLFEKRMDKGTYIIDNNSAMYLFSEVLEERNWVLGGNGETCQSVCNKTGRVCNQVEQSKLTSPELLAKAMLEAGHTCSFIKDHRDYAGTPFYSSSSDGCVYLTPGATSVCDSTSYGHHRALCYCNCN